MWKVWSNRHRCDLPLGTIIHWIDGTPAGKYQRRYQTRGSYCRCGLEGWELSIDNGMGSFYPWRFKETNCDECQYRR